MQMIMWRFHIFILFVFIKLLPLIRNATQENQGGFQKIKVGTVIPPSVRHRISNDNYNPCKAERYQDFAYETIKKNRRHKRAAVRKQSSRWTDGVIPFVIDEAYTGEQASLFRQAMRHWENRTCLAFIEKDLLDYNNDNYNKNNNVTSYIHISVGECGCCSWVGMGDGRRDVSLGLACDKFGIALHELGHAIGFWHEHTRPDRDDYVEVKTENVEKGQMYNFRKVDPDKIDSLGEPYDFASVMHYSKSTFSKATNLDTLVPKKMHWLNDRPPEIGQRLTLSAGDIRQTNKMYNCPTCGATLMNENGTFKSPTPTAADKNNNYNGGGGGGFGAWNSQNCVWRIFGSPGDKIVLNITALQISGNCKNDYLEVRDGFYHKSPLIGRYCKMPDKNLISTSYRLWILYRSETFPNWNSFSANYQLKCGGDITDKKQGQITSPNYPYDYFNNKDCVWTIKVAFGSIIVLQVNKFELERQDECHYDYLEIRDGPTNRSRLINRYCDRNVNGFVVKSSTNSMLIRFVSDGSVAQSGFSATFYEEIDECASSTQNKCQQICVNTYGSYTCKCRHGYDLSIDGRTCEYRCGGIIEEQSKGVIQSPNYPNLYPKNKDCIWEIRVPRHNVIALNLTHLNIEKSNDLERIKCKSDYLQIFTGSLIKQEAKLLAKLCGNHLPEKAIVSLSNVLAVQFHSDFNLQLTGFVAVFTTDNDECAKNNGGCQQLCTNFIGSYQCSCYQDFFLHPINKHDCLPKFCRQDLNASYGQLMSQNWPEEYPASHKCAWIIETYPGHRIKITFTNFDLESNPDCTYDYLLIRDGPKADSELLGRYCGLKLPEPSISSSHNLYVEFNSDSIVQRKGFHATHSTVCGNRLQVDKKPLVWKKIYSHANYGTSNYQPHMKCEWTITSDKFHGRIRFRFIAFDIESGTKDECNYDVVNIYFGQNFIRNRSKHTSLCGLKNHIRHDFTSDGNLLRIEFKTDNTIQKRGFIGEYALAND